MFPGLPEPVKVKIRNRSRRPLRERVRLAGICAFRIHRRNPSRFPPRRARTEKSRNFWAKPLKMARADRTKRTIIERSGPQETESDAAIQNRKKDSACNDDKR